MKFKVLSCLSGEDYELDSFVDEAAKIYADHSIKFVDKKEKQSLCKHLNNNITSAEWDYTYIEEFTPNGFYLPEKKKLMINDKFDYFIGQKNVSLLMTGIHEVGHALQFDDGKLIIGDSRKATLHDDFGEALNSAAEMMVAIDYFKSGKFPKVTNAKLCAIDKKGSDAFMPMPTCMFDYDLKLELDTDKGVSEYEFGYSYNMIGLFRVLKTLDIPLVDAIRCNTFLGGDMAPTLGKFDDYFTSFKTDKEKLKALAPFTFDDCQNFVAKNF